MIVLSSSVFSFSFGLPRKFSSFSFRPFKAAALRSGAIIGISLGIALSQGIAATTPLPASVAPWSIVAATLLGGGVGILAGIYPASRASRLDPIAALRQE